MASQPAELLLIKDQYDLAFRCLSQGLAAEQSGGGRTQALEYYRRGKRHLAQGLEIPADGERHRGPPWDAARQLQQKMRGTLKNLTQHLSDLETEEQTVQMSGVLMEFPAGVCPALGHLYPSLTGGSSQTPVPELVPTPVQDVPWIVSPESPSLPPRNSTLPVVSGEQPPAYTPQPTEGHQSLGYSLPGAGLGLLRGRGGGVCGGVGEELLFIPSGVQMFFVAPDGQVSSMFQPGYLRIVSAEGGSPRKDATAGGPSAFLHVCDWLYPLAPDTPVLLANSGIFMFPDMLAESAGSYVGIVLSAELPLADRELFHDLLSQLTELRVQAPVDGEASEAINLSEKVPLGPSEEETKHIVTEEEKPPLPEWSEKMAQQILAGATWLSKGFVRGAEATGKAIHKGASKLRSNMTPEDTPVEVSPQVTKGLQVAQQATGGAVRVSQFLVNGMSTVAGAVGEKLAPHLKKHGAKLIPESLKKSKDGRASNLDGAKLVATSSVQGVSTVWTALETGAKNIGKSVASETVMTAKYKYGDDAGDATDTAVQSVINVGVAAYNIDHLGLKAILKCTGKKTAKALMPEHHHGGNEQPAPPEDDEKQNNDLEVENEQAASAENDTESEDKTEK